MREHAARQAEPECSHRPGEGRDHHKAADGPQCEDDANSDAEGVFRKHILILSVIIMSENKTLPLG